MSLKRIAPETFALIVVGLLVLVVGAYTDNGGFRLAGAILLVVGVLVAFRQARG